ncbi:MAG: hypothetical protein LBD32_01195 [Cytophagales bacterium]|jgi:chorismate mutase|nr:hypothetical protein [Cytophagales bacterium]
MNKLFKGSNSVNLLLTLFKSSRITLLGVTVSSCDNSDGSNENWSRKVKTFDNNSEETFKSEVGKLWADATPEQIASLVKQRDTIGDSVAKLKAAIVKEKENSKGSGGGPYEKSDEMKVIEKSLVDLEKATNKDTVKSILTKLANACKSISVDDEARARELTQSLKEYFVFKPNGNDSDFCYKQIELIAKVGATVDSFKEYMNLWEKLGRIWDTYNFDFAGSKVTFSTLIGVNTDILKQCVISLGGARIFCGKGSDATKIKLGWTGNWLINDVIWSENELEKVGKLLNHCHELFPKDFLNGVVFDWCNFDRKKVKVKICDCAERNIFFEKIQAWVPFLKVERVTAKNTEIKLVINSKEAIIRFNDFTSFADACSCLKDLFGSSKNMKGTFFPLPIEFEAADTNFCKVGFSGGDKISLFDKDMTLEHNKFMNGIKILIDLGVTKFKGEGQDLKADSSGTPLSDKDGDIFWGGQQIVKKGYVHKDQAAELITILQFLGEYCAPKYTFQNNNANLVFKRGEDAEVTISGFFTG